MDDLQFGCTFCGRCCQGHSLPLTLNEAIAWLEDGGQVSIFCEGYPYLELADSAEEELLAEHRKRRSFAVRCGEATARVTTIFVGRVAGSCRNLGEDLKCRIYERRPLVCRIYPAEISPFIQLDPALKSCPPEAWEKGDRFLAGGQLVDAHLRWLIEKSKQTDRDDVPQKNLICSRLGIHVSGVAGEGYIAYEPDGHLLLDVIRSVQADASCIMQEAEWWFFSPLAQTAERLRAKSFSVVCDRPAEDGYKFLYGAGRTS